MERDAQRLRHNMCALRRDRLYAGAGGGGGGHGGGGGREQEEVRIEGDLCWNVVEVQLGLGRGRECRAGSCQVQDEEELSSPEGLLAALMATLSGLQSAGEVFDIITLGALMYERFGTQQETQQGAHRVHRLLDAILPLAAPASKSAPDGGQEGRGTGGGSGRGGRDGGGARGGVYPEFVRRQGAGCMLVTDYLCYDALIFSNHPASGGLAADDAGIECGRSRALLDRWLENRETKTHASGSSSLGVEEEEEEEESEEGLGVIRRWHLFLQRIA